MREVTKISVWKSDKGEFRIYITFNDSKQGCYYKTGNAYQVKGEIEGMTEDEKKSALQLCIKSLPKGENSKWVTLYENQIENLKKYGTTIVPKSAQPKIENPQYAKTYSPKYKSYDEEDMDIHDRQNYKSNFIEPNLEM